MSAHVPVHAGATQGSLLHFKSARETEEDSSVKHNQTLLLRNRSSSGEDALNHHHINTDHLLEEHRS